MKKMQGFQKHSAKLGGLKSRRVTSGFPEFIKNPELREKHVNTVLNNRRFDGANEVTFKDTSRPILNWNLIKKFKGRVL